MGKFYDLTGQKFGSLTAIRYMGCIPQGKHSKTSSWLCRCECGNEVVRSSADLRGGKTTNCGVKVHKRLSTKSPDITDKRFGRLTAIKRTANQNGKVMWLFKCDCGNEKEIPITYVAGAGKTRSCGCLQAEITSKVKTKHGGDGTRLYHIYRDMIGRCYDLKDKGYHNYGGRGIAVSDIWKCDFVAFRDWAYANGYDDNAPRGVYTLDRIDVNGDYSPENCRWVNMKTQMNNTRFNIRFDVYGENLTLAEIAEKYNINYHTLYNRVRKHNWNIYDAINLPRGTYVAPRNKQFMKKCMRLSDGQVFNSCHEAAEQLGCSYSLISLACTGKVKTALGSEWKYV